MQGSRMEKFISWTIALVSAAIAWQLDFPTLLRSLAINLGIMVGTPFYHVFVDGGISFIFVSIAWLAIRIYEDIIWRWWPSLGCKRGWWIYGLVAEREKGPFQRIEVVGYFYLLHTTTKIRVKEGFAFYFENSQISPRGNWTSNLVWIEENQIHFWVNMHAVRPRPEAVPSRAEGYMAFSHTLSHTLTGIESWQGYFHDIGERKDVSGKVYAERLSAFSVHKANEAEQIMRRYAEKLVKKV